MLERFSHLRFVFSITAILMLSTGIEPAHSVPLSPLAESPPAMPPADPCGCVSCDESPHDVAAVHSVYLHSGELHHEAMDLHIVGRGLDFKWTRKYRSRIGPNTAMGNGWDFSYNIFIEQAGPDLILHDGNTRDDLYLFNPAMNTWEADEFFREFTFDPNPIPFGTYTLTFPDTSEWRFLPLDGTPQAGRIGEISDRNGNTLVFEYNPVGQLVTIHDTLDSGAHTRDINIVYNANGLIETVTDFTGRGVTYEYYDGIQPGGNFGDLRSVTTPAVVGTPHGNDFPAGKTTIYTYSTGFADPTMNSNLLTITDPMGQTYLVNEYAPTLNPGDIEFDHVIGQFWGDPTDRIDIVYSAVIPDPGNNFASVKATVNDRVGNVSEHFYNAQNRFVLDRDHTGRADPSLPTDLDLVINPPVAPLRPGFDPSFFETRYEYNIDGLNTLIQHPNGNLTQSVYELDIDPLAARRVRGNLREVHRMPGVLGGDQAQIDEFFEYQPGFGCCGTNFVTRHVDGRGNETTHAYDGNGNRLQTVHRIPSIVEDFQYNVFGQRVLHVHPDNGSGSRREDVFTYYGPVDGCMSGYLKESIIDAPGFGLTTTYEYDCLGRMIRSIDPRGNDDHVEYNALDQVVRTLSRDVTGGGVRYERLQFYDANDNIVRIDVENRDDSGALQPNTHFTTIYEYDILNYQTRICHELNDVALGAGNQACVALPPADSVTTEFEYDANRNQTLTRLGESVNGNQPNNTTRTLYDERDLVFQSTRALGDPDQSTEQTDYDGNRNVVRRHYGIEDTPRIYQSDYDGYDRLLRLIDPMGNETEWHYDANGNAGGDQAPATPNAFAIRIRGETNDVLGDAGNIRLFETQYVYDSMDRRVLETREFFDTASQAPLTDGQSVTTTDYSDNSQIIRIVDDNAHETVTVYDTANRRSVVTDHRDNRLTYNYDPNSNITSITEFDKSDLDSPASDETFVTTYVYDSIDRRIRVIDSIGNTSDYGYDSRGNQTITTDAESNEQRSRYDGINRLVRTILDLDGDGADGDGVDILKIQRWDDSSRLTEQTDNAGNTTTYVYDALNRVRRVDYADCTSNEQSYDVHDNRITTTDANGSATTSTFDLLDRMISRNIAPAAGVSSDLTFENYRYDGLSRMVRAQDDDSLVLRSYDSMSNVTAEHLTVDTAGVSTVGTLTTAYDGVHNSTQSIYPGGRTVSCTYDELDRKKVISDGGGIIAAYDYIGPQRIERRDYGNGTRTDFDYDGVFPNLPGDFGLKRIVGLTHSVIALGVVIDDRTFVWSPMQNKTRRVDVRPAGPQLTHDYVYDSIYRMTRSTVSDAFAATTTDTTYALDGVGNRTTVGGNVDAGTYAMDATTCEPADAQLNQYSATSFDTRTYDANGNLTSFGCTLGDLDGDDAVSLADVPILVAVLLGNAFPTCGADVNGDGRHDGLDVQRLVDLMLGATPTERQFSIRYDYRNQMVEFDDSASQERHTYAYDAFGARIRQVVDADGSALETRYFYDGNHVIEEQDATGTTDATYVYGIHSDEALNMQRGGSDYFYHHDDLASTMAITDGAAAVVERYEYGDYGEPLITALSQNGDLNSAAASDEDFFPGPNLVQLLADDVNFADATRITGIRFRGGYALNPPVPAGDDFTIRVYADDGAGGTPGTLLHEEHVGDLGKVATGRIIAFASLTEYAYELRLTRPIEIPGGITCWIGIHNNTSGTGDTWGWETSSGGNGTVAVQVDGGAWQLDNSTDLAFEIITDRSAIGNPYLFTGRRYDSPTKWYYYRTRYLDPRAGRFTTRDTIGIWGDETNIGNGFAYVGNHPFTAVDPYGLAEGPAQAEIMEWWIWRMQKRWEALPDHLKAPSMCKGFKARTGVAHYWAYATDFMYRFCYRRMKYGSATPDLPAWPVDLRSGKPSRPTGTGAPSAPPRPQGPSHFSGSCFARCLAKNGVQPGETRRRWLMNKILEKCRKKCQKPGGPSRPRGPGTGGTATPSPRASNPTGGGVQITYGGLPPDDPRRCQGGARPVRDPAERFDIRRSNNARGSRDFATAFELAGTKPSTKFGSVDKRQLPE